ncbi:hypothetical protein BAUCODRAFT_145248 [Baudoinia panamericana UAMH 10762]|uniref:Uncharacterized protein n=1 Tax=Baudoinia panamericana (strain UAMH 10762) TaxID=717646 RepID=M2NL79_BAUPA|nr:uncharacterized protein BAUCODRAFT_145248 [Baudoinia panamericana UAMH 10762]EMC99910.1 hypothetical protein BAUCODRAFT_145248 [Baudoinia panamericana UAMH 10762]
MPPTQPSFPLSTPPPPTQAIPTGPVPSHQSTQTDQPALTANLRGKSSHGARRRRQLLEQRSKPPSAQELAEKLQKLKEDSGRAGNASPAPTLASPPEESGQSSRSAPEPDDHPQCARVSLGREISDPAEVREFNEGFHRLLREVRLAINARRDRDTELGDDQRSARQTSSLRELERIRHLWEATLSNEEWSRYGSPRFTRRSHFTRASDWFLRRFTNQDDGAVAPLAELAPAPIAAEHAARWEAQRRELGLPLLPSIARVAGSVETRNPAPHPNPRLLRRRPGRGPSRAQVPAAELVRRLQRLVGEAVLSDFDPLDNLRWNREMGRLFGPGLAARLVNVTDRLPEREDGGILTPVPTKVTGPLSVPPSPVRLADRHPNGASSPSRQVPPNRDRRRSQHLAKSGPGTLRSISLPYESLPIPVTVERQNWTAGVAEAVIEGPLSTQDEEESEEDAASMAPRLISPSRIRRSSRPLSPTSPEVAPAPSQPHEGSICGVPFRTKGLNELSDPTGAAAQGSVLSQTNEQVGQAAQPGQVTDGPNLPALPARHGRLLSDEIHDLLHAKTGLGLRKDVAGSATANRDDGSPEAAREIPLHASYNMHERNAAIVHQRRRTPNRRDLSWSAPTEVTDEHQWVASTTNRFAFPGGIAARDIAQSSQDERAETQSPRKQKTDEVGAPSAVTTQNEDKQYQSTHDQQATFASAAARLISERASLGSTPPTMPQQFATGDEARKPSFETLEPGPSSLRTTVQVSRSPLLPDASWSFDKISERQPRHEGAAQAQSLPSPRLPPITAVALQPSNVNTAVSSNHDENISPTAPFVLAAKSTVQHEDQNPSAGHNPAERLHASSEQPVSNGAGSVISAADMSVQAESHLIFTGPRGNSTITDPAAQDTPNRRDTQGLVQSTLQESTKRRSEEYEREESPKRQQLE